MSLLQLGMHKHKTKVNSLGGVQPATAANPCHRQGRHQLSLSSYVCKDICRAPSAYAEHIIRAVVQDPLLGIEIDSYRLVLYTDNDSCEVLVKLVTTDGLHVICVPPSQTEVVSVCSLQPRAGIRLS